MKKYLVGLVIVGIIGISGVFFPLAKEAPVGANQKISALTSLSSADSADLLPIVDTSATETKQISISNLFNLTVGLFGSTASLTSNLEVRGTASASQYYNIPTQVTIPFYALNIPTTRAGAASSSTGYEFGTQIIPTAANTFAAATSSADFAITMSSAGKIKGCAVKYDTLSTTGAVSVMITKNGVLLTSGVTSGKYCEIGNFALGGNVKNSASQTIPGSEITFVAGDRFGLVASSTNLSAATMDGVVNMAFEFNN